MEYRTLSGRLGESEGKTVRAIVSLKLLGDPILTTRVKCLLLCPSL